MIFGTDFVPDRLWPQLPQDIVRAAVDYADQVDGGQRRPLATEPGSAGPPWPDGENPMLAYLLNAALVMAADGMDLPHLFAHLAAHAWYEGHVEGYLRGRAEAD